MESAAELNPYSGFLEGRDALEIIEATPPQLSRFVHDADSARLIAEPAPGKWSIRHILCHLADCELVFGYRLRQTAAQTNHVIQPFDQDIWTASYARLDVQLALQAFTALRRWNAAFIRALTPETLGKQVTHPERGTMTFQTIVETMAGHDINHLRQLQNLLP